MLFYIRFRGQLRRTKPELAASLENAIAESASAAGGSVENGRKTLGAVFDDDRIGFWLNMVVFIEKAHLVLKKFSSESFGFALVIYRDNPKAASASQTDSLQKLCLSLAGTLRQGPNGRSIEDAWSSPAAKIQNNTGIWCSAEVREALEPYMVFNNPDGSPGPSGPVPGHHTRKITLSRKAGNDIYNEYREFQEFRAFGKAGASSQKEYPLREKMERTLALGPERNTILLGPEFTGKRNSIYHFCEGFLGDVPPLVIRFNTGGYGLVCFTDAYTPRIRSFIMAAGLQEAAEELETIHTTLFRERLREEWSPYMIRLSRDFFKKLLASYDTALRRQSVNGILILEDISGADICQTEIIKDVYSAQYLPEKNAECTGKLLVLASDSSSEENLKSWSDLFSRILKFTSEELSSQEKGNAQADSNTGDVIADGITDVVKNIPLDLWETAYNILLLARYFPVYLFPKLLEEEGLSQDMYFRAAQMLADIGVLVHGDARPRIPGLMEHAGKIPQDRKEKIEAAVRNRIFAWTISGKLRPCFNLLKILSELGERAGDVIILKAIRADVLNGTFISLEEALKKKYFTSFTGGENAPLLEYIYESLKALVWGGADEIHRVFKKPLPPIEGYGGFMAQVKINLVSYYLGSRNIDAASEAIREAMILNRALGRDTVPAYRLFSLVNLFRQRIDDALEYISFALEEAEKAEQNEELYLTCYYASSLYLIYGNLSKAEKLAKRAEDAAMALGQTGWWKKSKFLRGRLCFEIGRYSDALKIFESIAAEQEIETPEDTAVNTINAWVFRTRNFLGRFSPGENVDNFASPDRKIFEIEAAYLSADYERAVELAASFLSSHSEKRDFLFTEQPDWRSGFSQCEFMYQPGKNPVEKIAWVYSAMAGCALHLSRAQSAGTPRTEEPTDLPSPQEQKTKILNDMQRFMREELLPDTDPNDAFFFHAWYCMLRDTQSPNDTRSSQADIGTVVSMAYKRLQKRAGRIDDAETKQVYLNQSRWNSTLYLAAREHKLI